MGRGCVVAFSGLGIGGGVSCAFFSSLVDEGP